MNIITNISPNINRIQFKSKINEENFQQERAPFFKETDAIIDRVYDNYRKSLNEVSFKDIKTTALEVAQETQTPKKDVLKAMQLLTQFSNMNDLKLVSQAINNSKIEYLGNQGAELCFNAIDKGFSARNIANISSETGVHRSLEYLLDKKKLAPFEYGGNGKFAVILDEEKIENLEEVKRTEPEKFKALIDHDDINFFYISGWDSGISVVDRTKDLKIETKALLERAKEQNLPLEKAIDSPYLDRINELGIKPTIIKNENEANEVAIYNQMRPEQIRTKGMLYNVIEANTLERFYGHSDTKKAVSNHIAAKYLEDTLSVYTFEKMSKDLKTIHEKINKYAADKNKEPIYVIPSRNIKSSDFINYSFKKINNIDPSKFIYMDQVSSYFKRGKDREDKSLIVILDDCALSGNSMRDILSFSMDLKNVSGRVPILFANLKCSDEALNNFENESGHPVDIIYVDKIKSHYVDNDQLEDIIGEPQYRENAYSLMFPYMAPDNNSEFATNVALLHNSKYNASNFSSKFQRKILKQNDLEQMSESDKEIYNKIQEERRNFSYCTKNITDDVLEASARYAKIIGMKPVSYVDLPFYKVTPNELKLITDEIYKKQ